MAMYFGKKNSSKSGPKFVESKKGTGVRVTPGKGGVNIGTATHCESKRAASNVKTYAKG